MSIRSCFLALLVTLFTTLSFLGCSSLRHEQKNAAKSVRSYISLDLEYARYQSILKAIEEKIGHSLKSRGEAHITIITPPEYKKLSQKISSQQIDELAKIFLKSSPIFSLVCVGTSKKELNEIFYVVIESNDLLQFRLQLSKVSGLAKQDFDPQVFYPHITLGFTDHDLHYEDGVIKNAATCPDHLKDSLKASL